MRYGILLEGGFGTSHGAEVGIFFFGLFLLSLVVGLFILLLAVIMSAFRPRENQNTPDPNLKRLRKVGLISILVALCSALLTAVFCSGI
ncbi:hypothetical protein [Rhizosphaericola mali]|uniref:Uncharacterized protein n=1 Tax=Rhizosphaericola mali TaxID=2545455 RepID=A0A5P2G8U9_9BACT|nr:hypothetical protein [Rhizosphaericola mali]QES90729.1 hypothetical protein E0W69_019415 [Rhizosphaericola mali]